MLDQILPSSFVQALAGVVFFLALLMVLVSLKSSVRSHAIRLAALLLVSGIALFSNQAWNYFAAIFIVATAVTELDFLQNLAAIIRGNSDYFKYKIESQSSEQVEAKLKQQQVDLEKGLGKVQQMQPTGRPDISHLAKLERIVRDRLALSYGRAVEPNVRVAFRSGRSFEFDGAVFRPSSRELETVIDIRFLQPTMNDSAIREPLVARANSIMDYMAATSLSVNFHVVFVTFGFDSSNQEKISRVVEGLKSTGVPVGCTIYAAEELEKELKS
ncbi:hypothetical protein ACNRDG_05980 [Ralstonia pseudosolanacearum]|uniref:hypothetical protein n=1 Tax=Ralstonia pseudosolanacearum TaxID=1310165 RepID=UPI003AB0A776